MAKGWAIAIGNHRSSSQVGPGTRVCAAHFCRSAARSLMNQVLVFDGIELEERVFIVPGFPDCFNASLPAITELIKPHPAAHMFK